jgi:hypothetical protein
MKLLSGIAVLWLTSSTDASGPKPRITPFFSNIESGPAFMVECLNTTRQPIMSNARFWELAYRVDGKTPDPKGTIGPGLGMLVQPGEPWRGILTLRQSQRGGSPSTVLGALVRATELQPIEPGRHRIAIRCGGVWSEDAEFYLTDEATR